jgi:excisionase family DNA binding protein
MKDSVIGGPPRQRVLGEQKTGLPTHAVRTADAAPFEAATPPSKTPVSQLLTLSQVAERLQLGHTSVDLLIRQGKLRVVRFGRAVRVTEAALADCITVLETATIGNSLSNRSVVEEILNYQRQRRGSQ